MDEELKKEKSDTQTFVYDARHLSYDEAKRLAEYRTEITRNDKDERMSIISKLVEGKQILDLGCNIGRLSLVLAERGYSVLGMDRLPEAIAIAKEFCSHKNVVYTTDDVIENPNYDNFFDSIIFAETIEHVDEPFTYFRAFHRMLKPNGILILSTPNACSIKNMFYALSYRKTEKRKKIVKSLSDQQAFTGTQLEHLYAWDFVTLIKLLDRAGFDVVEEHFTGGIQFKIPKLKAITITNRRLLKPIETLMTTQIIKARKRSNK